MSLSNTPDPAIRQAVVRQDLDNVLHPIVQHRALETSQVVVTAAEGSTIYDADGTGYLDAMAGLWCVNIGYGRSELADVAADQMRQLSYFPHSAMNVPAAALAETINELMGGGYHTYFVNSGSEANEAGFKFARQYMKHEYPGQYRFKTISRYFAYHGTTLATLDAGGMGERKAKFEPFSGDFVHVAHPHCYRCPFGLSYPSCNLACVKNLETAILGEGPETVAAVLVEPIMSGVGVAGRPTNTCRKSKSCAGNTTCCCTSTRSSTALAAPARCSRTSITASRRTSSPSPRAFPAPTCRLPRRW